MSSTSDPISVPVPIPGTQFSQLPLWQTRKAAHHWARRYIVGSYRNEAMGCDIYVGGNGIRKALEAPAGSSVDDTSGEAARQTTTAGASDDLL